MCVCACVTLSIFLLLHLILHRCRRHRHSHRVFRLPLIIFGTWKTTCHLIIHMKTHKMCACISLHLSEKWYVSRGSNFHRVVFGFAFILFRGVHAFAGGNGRKKILLFAHDDPYWKLRSWFWLLLQESHTHLLINMFFFSSAFCLCGTCDSKRHTLTDLCWASMWCD